VVMKYLDDLSISEISSAIDKTHNNVRVLLHRSIAALKDILDEEDNQ
jgi:DNA-directed RNA polymerase specialized sigma24 family protein